MVDTLNGYIVMAITEMYNYKCVRFLDLLYCNTLCLFVKNILVSRFSCNNVFYGKNCIMKSKFYSRRHTTEYDH